VLHACLKWFKQSKFKNLKGCKKPKERWWLFSKWSGRLKKIVQVGVHHFLLTMIFWWPRNLNYCCNKRKKFWNTMEVNWLFFSNFFLYFSSSFSFDDDVVTFFKEGAIGKKNLCCLNFRHHITNFCNHYCCYRTLEPLLLLRKKYVGKMSTTKNVIPPGM